MATNPYANPNDKQLAGDALGPRSAFAAPDYTVDAPYVDEAGGNWAIPLGNVFGPGTDAMRLGTQVRRDFVTDPTIAPEQGFYAQRDADDARRHAVETQDADGWEERQSPPMTFAPNPRSMKIPNSRLTQSMAPTTYFFTRPFDVHHARRFNGDHFSMADHRRNYDILGMQPARSARNTYRLEPGRWDTNVVDMPEADPGDRAFPGKITAIEIAPMGNRSYRAG